MSLACGKALFGIKPAILTRSDGMRLFWTELASINLNIGVAALQSELASMDTLGGFATFRFSE